MRAIASICGGTDSNASAALREAATDSHSTSTATPALSPEVMPERSIVQLGPVTMSARPASRAAAAVP